MIKVKTYGLSSLLSEGSALDVCDDVEVTEKFCLLPEFQIQKKIIPRTCKNGTTISFEQLLFSSLDNEKRGKNIAIINTSINIFSITTLNKCGDTFNPEPIVGKRLFDIGNLSQQEVLVIFNEIDAINNESLFERSLDLIEDQKLSEKGPTVIEFHQDVIKIILDEIDSFQANNYDEIWVYGDLINQFKIAQRTDKFKSFSKNEIQKVIGYLEDHSYADNILKRSWKGPVSINYDKIDNDKVLKENIIDEGDLVIQNQINRLDGEILCVGKDLNIKLSFGKADYNIAEANLFSKIINQLQISVFVDSLLNLNLNLICEEQKVNITKKISNYFE